MVDLLRHQMDQVNSTCPPPFTEKTLLAGERASRCRVEVFDQSLDLMCSNAKYFTQPVESFTPRLVKRIPRPTSAMATARESDLRPFRDPITFPTQFQPLVCFWGSLLALSAEKVTGNNDPPLLEAWIFALKKALNSLNNVSKVIGLLLTCSCMLTSTRPDAIS